MRHRMNNGVRYWYRSIGVFMLGAGLASAAQEKIKFPVGVGTKTIGTNMFWLGAKKGFFDEVGLDVQPVLLRGTTITMQALVSESLYLALGSADAPSARPPSGADLVAVGGVVNGLTQAIVASKAIQIAQRAARRDHRRASTDFGGDQCFKAHTQAAWLGVSGGLQVAFGGRRQL